MWDAKICKIVRVYSLGTKITHIITFFTPIIGSIFLLMVAHYHISDMRWIAHPRISQHIAPLPERNLGEEVWRKNRKS